MPALRDGIGRRQFLQAVAAALPGLAAAHAAPQNTPVIIDTHMHVWGNDARRYPFKHPYQPEFTDAPHEATVEMLFEDMDRHGCTHAVLVQVIYHGWDNTYVAECVRRFPQRFRAHGLIDPTDPKVDEKLTYWVKEHGLHGMRFSPLYYKDGAHGGDAWLTAEPAHRLWRQAEKLEAVFNFFITAPQLPKLEQMVQRYPGVRVIIDHLSQLDLAADDPELDIRRMLHMARYPNVWVKVSELSSVSKSKMYPFTDAYPFVKRVYETFGGEKLLFGTGYPGTARAHYKRPNLAQEIDLIATRMAFFSAEDRRKILGLNAAKLWGFATGV